MGEAHIAADDAADDAAGVDSNRDDSFETYRGFLYRCGKPKGDGRILLLLQ